MGWRSGSSDGALAYKHEALNSDPSTAKKKKKSDVSDLELDGKRTIFSIISSLGKQ
jgi:hypothetical protein